MNPPHALDRDWSQEGLPVLLAAMHAGYLTPVQVNEIIERQNSTLRARFTRFLDYLLRHR